MHFLLYFRRKRRHKEQSASHADTIRSTIGHNKENTHHTYFELDPEFLNTDLILEGSDARSSGYAKVQPRSSRILKSSHSTFKGNGIPKDESVLDEAKAIANTIDQGNVMEFDESKECEDEDDEQMKINDLYHSYAGDPQSKDASADVQLPVGEYPDGVSNEQEEGMVTNDLYHSYARNPQSGDATADGHFALGEYPGGVSNEQEEGMVTNDPRPSYKHPQRVTYPDSQDGQEEGMVLNDMYHSYSSTTDPSASQGPPQRVTDRDAMSDDQEEGMVPNDLYHSYSPATNPNAAHGHSERVTDLDSPDEQEEGMVLNDMYHSYQPSGSDCDNSAIGKQNASKSGHYTDVVDGTNRVSDTSQTGHYADIDEVPVVSDASVSKPRPSAYEEIADFNHV